LYDRTAAIPVLSTKSGGQRHPLDPSVAIVLGSWPAVNSFHHAVLLDLIALQATDWH
jgi:hypothetical protein